MPRIGRDDFLRIIGEGKGTKGPRIPKGDEEELLDEGKQVEKITDEREWKAKVAEIVSEARSEIEKITPQEFADRIDDEMRGAIGGEIPEAMPEAMPKDIGGL